MLVLGEFPLRLGYRFEVVTLAIEGLSFPVVRNGSDGCGCPASPAEGPLCRGRSNDFFPTLS